MAPRSSFLAALCVLAAARASRIVFGPTALGAVPQLGFFACPSPPAPEAQFNYTGTPSSPGALQWAANQSLCAAPQGCAAAAGAAAALAPCAAVARCASWMYDTYTSFTLTAQASGNRLASSGAGGARATVEAPSGGPEQQFIIQGGTISPASDSTLCLGFM